MSKAIPGGLIITDLVYETGEEEPASTPGLSHLLVLKLLDRTGLSPWLLGLGCFLTLVIIGMIMLIIVGYPDPDMYRNTIAYTAIISFFLVFYFAMGRGWHQDALKLLQFDQSLAPHMEVIRPSRRVLYFEYVIALICVTVNVNINNELSLDYSPFFAFMVLTFVAIQWLLIVFCIDIVFRQLICLMKIVKKIRVDLLDADFYSTLASAMVRHVGLYIFGLCIVSLSYIVFTEGELSAGEMALLMMPWYMPGLFIISMYIVPYNVFRHRMRARKFQELNCVTAALSGNTGALSKSLLKDEPLPSKIDLLNYRDRISAIREWPFTDRIRAMVLFGILPPLTWVIAALIEITIEGAL